MLINVDPVIAQVGPFVLSWQGLFIALGLLLGLLVGAGELSRREIHPDVAYDAALWIIVPGLVGARLFHVFDSWNYYAYHPLDIVALNQGGAAIYGAILVGTFFALLYVRRRRIAVGRFVDAAALAQAVGLAVGEVGDFLTGAYLGRPTTGFLAVKYVNPNSFDQSGVFVYPAAGYEILWNLGIVAVLLWLRGKRAPVGLSFWVFTALFAIGQIWIGFLRDLPVDVAGLGQVQLIAIGCLALSSVVLLGFAIVHLARHTIRAAFR